MDFEQANRLAADYGALVLFLVALFLLLAVVIKSWPIITGFVTTINILLALPTWQVGLGIRLDETDRKMDERMDGTDSRIADLETLVAKIDHQVHPNGGGSLNDQVAKAQGGVDQILEALGLPR